MFQPSGGKGPPTVVFVTLAAVLEENTGAGGGHLSLHCVCEEGGGDGVEGGPGLLLC